MNSTTADPTDRWTVTVFAPAFIARNEPATITTTTGAQACRLIEQLYAARLITSGWADPYNPAARRPPEPAGVAQLMTAAFQHGIDWPADLCHDEPENLGRWLNPGGLWTVFPGPNEPTPAEAFGDALHQLAHAIRRKARQDLERLRHWARTEWKMIRDLYR